MSSTSFFFWTVPPLPAQRRRTRRTSRWSVGVSSPSVARRLALAVSRRRSATFVSSEARDLGVVSSDRARLFRVIELPERDALVVERRGGDLLAQCRLARDAAGCY
jgi:hypothetical protein